MKLQIENSLKEFRWDKMKNKMIDKDLKKRLLMVEDFVLNLYARSYDVYKFCETSNQGFPYIIPSISEKDKHTEAYQKSLLNLEGIYQFVEFMSSKQIKVEDQNNVKDELAVCKRELNASLSQLKSANLEKEAWKRRCKDIVKQTQMVHEKCKLKKLHYKELIRDNEHLLAKNKTMDNDLKACESKIAGLAQDLDTSKKHIQKTQRELNSFKNKIHKMTIEINLLEKINIEQAIHDEDTKEKMQRLKEHDEELYEHLSTCNEKDSCKYTSKKENDDAVLKYEAAKIMIKRMQVTLKKKTKDLQEKTEDVRDLTKKLIEAKTTPCNCDKNQIVDNDGIVEENRRLWDGYFHLQLEHVSTEKEIEATEAKYQEVRNRLNEVNKEKHRLHEENTIHQNKISECLEVIENLKEKHKRLEETLKQFEDQISKATSEKQQVDTELTQLKSFAEHQRDTIRDHEHKFISLENEYLSAQELLEEYKISFEKVEELLDNKNVEHEEKMSAVMEELAEEKSENDLLLSILSSPLVNCVVKAYFKMTELEECVENLINLKDDQISNDLLSSNMNYIENNNTIPENNNEEIENIDKHVLYEELKYKIRDLKNKCSESIEKLVKNANNKLEKYKMTLANDENYKEVKAFVPSTFDSIKLQLGTVCT